MPVASDLGWRGSRRAFAKDDNKGGWSEQAFSTDLHKVNFISPIGSEEVYPLGHRVEVGYGHGHG
jgi:hypothetical protein